jgi:hypothetical protein
MPSWPRGSRRLTASACGRWDNRSPGFDLSENTLKLLEKHGILYDSSLMGNDFYPYHPPRVRGELRQRQPLRRNVEHRRDAVTWYLDDFPHFEFIGSRTGMKPQSSVRDLEDIFRLRNRTRSKRDDDAHDAPAGHRAPASDHHARRADQLHARARVPGRNAARHLSRTRLSKQKADGFSHCTHVKTGRANCVMHIGETNGCTRVQCASVYFRFRY